MTDELTELRIQVAGLTEELAQLKASLNPAPAQQTTPMTRRVALGTIAAGVAGAVVFKPAPAEATTGTMRFGAVNNAGASPTQLNSSDPASTFHGACNGTPVQNYENAAGVSGFSLNGCGIRGVAKGIANANAERHVAGVVGQSDAYAGVVGASASSIGVFGKSKTGTAVQALAVGLQATGMYGVSHGASGGGAFGGVVGDSDTNAGVVGFTSANARAAGEFIHTGNGRGATFKGDVAQARLVPNTVATHPASGLAGDLFVDNAKRLWFCKGGNTWVQLG